MRWTCDGVIRSEHLLCFRLSHKKEFRSLSRKENMNTSKISGRSRAFVLFCLLLAPLASAQQQSGVIAIQGATLITGTGSPAIRNSAIVIETGLIAAVGT